ncbi:DUF3021 family protein [Virgibacillus dokdonensis]|uniref:DUF3021 domain-containing protein n=1 Tax=Virgibacillus dokdonensis TaxID=302167 RepID=A0A2K9J486_9BACI|nr:DUF3021 family protein [Virgibacillus dokdonensis]AUJ23800.1 hypothetical protein A21D_00687 [Virgibacillus dokdonensis]
MWIEAIKRLTVGVAIAGLITFIVLTVITFQDIEISIMYFWKSALSTLFIASYFALASLLFEREHWSPLKQTSIHYLLSNLFFFPIAIWADWLHMSIKSLLFAIVIFTIIYTIIWIIGMWIQKRNVLQLNKAMK